MKKLLSCVFLTFILTAKGQVVEDVQFWNHLHLEHHLNERNTLNYELGYRFQITPFENKQSHQRISFTRKLNSPFSLGAGIASFEHFKATGIQWESRLFQDLNHTLKTEKIVWISRIRFEERWFWNNDHFDQLFRFRTRFKTGFEIPFQVLEKNLKVGLSDEIMMEVDPSLVNSYTNRILLNLTYEFNDQNSLMVQYNHQNWFQKENSIILPVFWISYKFKILSKS